MNLNIWIGIDTGETIRTCQCAVVEVHRDNTAIDCHTVIRRLKESDRDFKIRIQEVIIRLKEEYKTNKVVKEGEQAL